MPIRELFTRLFGSSSAETSQVSATTSSAQQNAVAQAANDAVVFGQGAFVTDENGFVSSTGVAPHDQYVTISTPSGRDYYRNMYQVAVGNDLRHVDYQQAAAAIQETWRNIAQPLNEESAYAAFSQRLEAEERMREQAARLLELESRIIFNSQAMPPDSIWRGSTYFGEYHEPKTKVKKAKAIKRNLPDWF